jgi:hypothetical protein
MACIESLMKIKYHNKDDKKGNKEPIKKLTTKFISTKMRQPLIT